MYVFLDESGDAGFRFNKGSSDYFIVALVITEEPTEIERRLSDLRYLLGYRADHEFRFAKTRPEVRSTLLDEVARMPVRIRALIIDKRRCESAVARDRVAFYAFALEEALFAAMPHLSAATLIIDESDKSTSNQRSLSAHIRATLGASKENRQLKAIRFLDSRSQDGLQVADAVCGALMEKARGRAANFARINNLLDDLREWG